jgi:CheY-like chemotaxis protein
MIEPAEFDRLVRDALANLYDNVALEVHPLNKVILKPPDKVSSNSALLRRVLIEAIDSLRPKDKDFLVTSQETRPYHILHDRFVEGISLVELQNRLAIGERQLRREQFRALRSLVSLLWNQTYPGNPYIYKGETEEVELSGTITELQAYSAQLEMLDLNKIVQGAVSTFEPRMQSEGVVLSHDLPDDLPQVQGDRVILRQVILSLFTLSLRLQCDGNITVNTSSEIGSEQVYLSIQFHVDEQSFDGRVDISNALTNSHYWLEKLTGDLVVTGLAEEFPGIATLKVVIRRATQPVVLVVDDQQPAIRLYQRYLWHSNLHVIGLQDAAQVQKMASQLQPKVILLDVMMPSYDGWEILQTLKANPETQSIPVLVCSVWDEPELALSLGASGFLKKPIMQKVLLEALSHLGVAGM